MNGTLACDTQLVDQSFTERGQVDLVTFTGAAGQIIDLTLVSSFNATATLFGPSGGPVGSWIANSQKTFTLPEAGTYVVQVKDRFLTGTGTYNLGMECRLNPIAPVNGTLACGTLLVDQSFTKQGQVDLVTFTGANGQIIEEE